MPSRLLSEKGHAAPSLLACKRAHDAFAALLAFAGMERSNCPLKSRKYLCDVHEISSLLTAPDASGAVIFYEKLPAHLHACSPSRKGDMALGSNCFGFSTVPSKRYDYFKHSRLERHSIRVLSSSRSANFFSPSAKAGKFFVSRS